MPKVAAQPKQPDCVQMSIIGRTEAGIDLCPRTIIDHYDSCVDARETGEFGIHGLAQQSGRFPIFVYGHGYKDLHG
jgi:hypothetical protein